MEIQQETPISRIVLSRVFPSIPYKIEDKYTLRTVKASSQMFEGWLPTYGIVPDQWDTVLALPYFDKSSYHIWKDLVMFHSFIYDSPETYEYAETATNRDFENQELAFVDYSSSRTSDQRQYPWIIDFDQFPVRTWNPDDRFPKEEPTLSEEEMAELEKYGATMREIKPHLEYVEYSKAFHIFTRMKAANKSQQSLYNKIRLFVFAGSIWDITEVYRNEYASITFYVAILESIAGRPLQCNEPLKCEKCKRTLQQHDRTSLEDHFVNRFGIEFKKLRKARHSFVHSADCLEIADSLYEISDRRQQQGGTEDDCQRQESKLYGYIDDIERLKIIIRNNLIEMFLDYYRQASTE